MHIALYGGTFDPPHLGHMAVALMIREILSADQILLSVSHSPFKSDTSADAGHRLNMTRLMVQEMNQTGDVFEVLDWEILRPAPTFTIDTMRYLYGQSPEAKFTLCMGEDQFHLFEHWRDYQSILEIADLLVFARQHHENTTPDPRSEMIPLAAPPWLKGKEERVRCIDFHAPIASRVLRKKLAKAESLEGYLLKSVLDYIHRHSLYTIVD